VEIGKLLHKAVRESQAEFGRLVGGTERLEEGNQVPPSIAVLAESMAHAGHEHYLSEYATQRGQALKRALKRMHRGDEGGAPKRCAPWHRCRHCTAPPRCFAPALLTPRFLAAFACDASSWQ